MFKHFIFLFFLFIFAFSGCAFLRGVDSPESEDSYAEDLNEDGEYEEDEEYEDDESDEYYDEEEDDDGPGFFERLFGFGGGDDDDEEEVSDSIEDDGGLSSDEEYSDDSAYGEESGVGSQDEEMSSSEDTASDYNYSDEQESPDDTTPSTSSNTSEVSSTTTDEAQPAEPVAKPKNIPLNKILRVPYQKAGYLVNAVYIARSGDSFETVSQKIYNSQEAVNGLRQINSHIGSRPLKVGDKIYYNSPVRPNDSDQLLFYWQDINAPSSSYTLSPGDNIRTVASQLLGHPNSWKEIWAVNPELESKAEITKTIDIVYWPESVSGTDTMEPPTQVQPEPQLADEVPPALDSSSPPEEVVAPPPLSDEPPRPALPEGPNSSFPEMAPVPEKPKSSFLKQKEILIVLAGIAVAIFFIIRLILKKRKQRDFDYTATNIEV